MLTRKNQAVIVLIITVILVIAGGFYYFKFKNTANYSLADKSENNDVVAVIKNNEEKELKEPDKIDNKPSQPIVITLKIPDLDSKISVPDSFGTEGKRFILEQFSKVITVLKKDPKSVDDWLTLGVLKNQINDYLGAKEIWEYLISAFPKNPIAYGNLASLYAFDLKDAVKAEAAFKKALAVAPDQLQTYRNFAEFYKFILKDNEKAKAVLRQGVEKNFVNSGALQQLLDEYSK